MDIRECCGRVLVASSRAVSVRLSLSAPFLLSLSLIRFWLEYGASRKRKRHILWRMPLLFKVLYYTFKEKKESLAESLILAFIGESNSSNIIQ